jgi:hypothetical protein
MIFEGEVEEQPIMNNSNAKFVDKRTAPTNATFSEIA